MSQYAPNVSADHFQHLLSGNTFSQLDTTNHLLSNDLMLVTSTNKTSASSFAIQVHDLIQSIIEISMKKLGVGSMAYESKWKYAKADHTHDSYYNKTEFEPLLGDGICIATIDDLTTDNQLSLHVPEMMPPTYPLVGTLKFVCSKAILNRNIDDSTISSDEFDGWVFADGSTFNIAQEISSRFTHAIEAYGNDLSTAITVPNLSSFLKASQANVEDFNTHTQQLGLAKHSHQVSSMQFDGSIDLAKDFSLSTYVNGSISKPSDTILSNPTLNGNIHRGKDTSQKIGSVPFKVNLAQISITGLSCGITQSENQIFKPRHHTFPVMIYIGGVV